jgi:peroxiredoxin
LGAERADNSTPLPTIVPAVGAAPSVGAAAPEFALPGTAGDTLALADLRGRKVLLNFWATWCGPCREEIPLMIEYQDELQAAGIELLAVNVGETPAKVARFVADTGMGFPVVMDTSTGVAQAYYLRAVPTSYLVDEDGVIEAIHLGVLMQDDLDAMIAAADD